MPEKLYRLTKAAHERQEFIESVPSSEISSSADSDVVGETEETQRRWVSGRQVNHQPWVLPNCLSHLGIPPLYLAVAWWGLLKGGAFTRADVSAAFHITPRRASDVMEHIHKVRTDLIQSEWLCSPPPRRCGEAGQMRIHSVCDTTAFPPVRYPDRKAPKTKKIGGNATKARRVSGAVHPLQSEGESMLKLWHRLTHGTGRGQV